MEDHHYLFPPQEANDQSDPLAKLIRLIFTHLKLTEKDFKQYHKNYFFNVLLKTDKIDETSDCGNLKSSIRKPNKISWYNFIRSLNVLEIHLVKIDVTFKWKGNTYTVSSKGKITEKNEYTDSPLKD